VALSAGAFAAQFLVENLLSGQPAQHIFHYWLALDQSGIASGHWWKFLSFGLLHADPIHVLANLLLLYFAGREVEPIIGSRHFAAIVLVGNFVGGLVSFAALPAQPLVGISAGVAAALVAFTTILPELEVTLHLFFIIPLRLRAKHLAYALLAVCGLCWWTLTALEMGPAGMIAGALFGWLYVKQLGFGNPLIFQRYIFEKRQRAARLERMTPEQFVRAEIDPILEKIAQHGMKSLTRAERKILEQGSAKIGEKAAQK
jgi:membrane associated rhomboid family serine protease